MRSKLAIWSFVIELALLLIGVLCLFGGQLPHIGLHIGLGSYLFTFSSLIIYILTLSILIILFLGPFVNVAGVILGIISLIKIKKNHLDGKWFAIGSLIIALVNLLIFFIGLRDFLSPPI